MIRLDQLNQYLLHKSYISGVSPSNSDLAVFKEIPTDELTKSRYSNVIRWYKHISSYSAAEKSQFTGNGEIPNLAAAPEAIELEGVKLKDEDEFDFDIFGSDDEDEKATKEAIAAKAEKKKAESKKAPLIQKSTVVLDIKPLGSEIDIEELAKLVGSIEMDGLIWGEMASEPLCFGINKLVACAEVEDDKVMMDDLEERITSFEDHVQSVDIVSFQKV